MMPSGLARRYARAFLDVANAQQKSGPLGQELAGFAGLLEQSHDLKATFANPIFPADQRQRVLNELTGRLSSSPPLRSLLNLLLERGRLDGVGEVAREYARLADDEAGRLRAQVKSARPLPADALTRLQQAVEAMTGKKVELSTEVDPKLLGGVVMQLGSQVYDGTIRAQLAALRQQLLEQR
jgi:F-type H+-transporting ATPase subunit delta